MVDVVSHSDQVFPLWIAIAERRRRRPLFMCLRIVAFGSTWAHVNGYVAYPGGELMMMDCWSGMTTPHGDTAVVRVHAAGLRVA